MSWQNINTTHNSELLNQTFISTLKSELEALQLPNSISQPAESQPEAATDAAKKNYLASGKIEVFEVLPWKDGQPSDIKNDIGFYLSVEEAAKKMAEKIGEAGWAEAILIIASADNAAGLHAELEKIDQAFSFSEARQAMRAAEAYANHEGLKRQLEKLPERSAKKSTGQLKFFTDEAPAASAIAVASAATTDKSTQTELQSFLQKRAQRLQELNNEVAEISSKSGAITSAAYFTGDIESQISSNQPPNHQAPMAAVFAIGGEIKDIKEALGL